MDITYNIKLSDLNKQFVHYLFNNDQLENTINYNENLNFLWDEIPVKLKKTHFKSKIEEFEKLINTLSVEKIDNISGYIYNKSFDELNTIFTSLIRKDNVDTFDNLFFKFLDVIYEKESMTLQVKDYILISGTNKKKVNKELEILKTKYSIVKNLQMGNIFKRKIIYILKKTNNDEK
jgi:uncharacterized protein YjaG (DUF416 family)